MYCRKLKMSQPVRMIIIFASLCHLVSTLQLSANRCAVNPGMALEPSNENEVTSSEDTGFMKALIENLELLDHFPEHFVKTFKEQFKKSVELWKR